MTKETWSYFIEDFSRHFQGKHPVKNYSFKSFKLFYAYKKWEGEELRRMDLEESFTGQFLKNGFSVSPKAFNPTANWFGVSKYSPDVLFEKEGKIVIMSIQGMACPYNIKYESLFNERAVKYIKIVDKENILYETWTGELPPKELINKFLI